jgi:3-oxoacyl-[acyl-carrier-protein] synthase-1
MKLVISAYTATCAAGTGLSALQESITQSSSGLSPNDFPGCELVTWIGRVASVEDVALPESTSSLYSRNNQLAWLGLQQDDFLEVVREALRSVGTSRMGVVMGTSTSSIGRTEEAYTKLDSSGFMTRNFLQPEVHNLHSPGLFVARALGVQGPSMTISTACSSSAKVFATAARWVSSGLVDAVLVGGVDSLCLSVLYGFNSLELVSGNPCRPFDAARDGISIGEAAGYALLSRPELLPSTGFALLGYGESCDAHHMSHPHPEGKGAVLAMRRALVRAGLSPSAIDYVNLHGTASKVNDQIETQAMRQVFNEAVHASSTKGWTGHTLGAAGILEAIITLEAMRHDLIPGTLNCEQPDAEFDFPILAENRATRLRFGMSNSFGFGGNNASLVFGRNDE